MYYFMLKKVRKTGNSLYVPLTKEFKKMKLKKGDFVFVEQEDNAIVLTTIENKGKYLVPIDSKLYDELKLLTKNYGDFNEYIENMFRKEIKKFKNPLTRPIRIKI